jgi:hypothetical protein
MQTWHQGRIKAVTLHAMIRMWPLHSPPPGPRAPRKRQESNTCSCMWNCSNRWLGNNHSSSCVCVCVCHSNLARSIHTCHLLSFTRQCCVVPWVIFFSVSGGPSDGDAISYSLRGLYKDQNQLSYKQNGRNTCLTRLPMKICIVLEIIRFKILPFNSK